MSVPSNDAALLELVATRLGSAVLSDALDRARYREQAMAARLRPVWPGAALVGRAHMVLTVDIYEVMPDSYRLEIDAVDALKPGDILLASTGPSTRTCFWGELLSTAARGRGARGAVIDGYVRDVRRIAAIAFPVFATGMSPVDSAGRSMVVEYGGVIACGGVLVWEGDLVVSDDDGVVVVPRAVAAEVIRRALEKVEGETRTLAALEQGLTLTDV